MQGALSTVRLGWQTARDAIAAADSGGTYDAAGTDSERLVSLMLNAADAVIDPINLRQSMGINTLELRAHFKNATDTATMILFGARADELEVKLISSTALVAGTQHTGHATARHFATTAVTTSYWNKTISVSAAESGTGIATIELDTRGYEKIWVFFSVISASDNVTVEYSGY